MGELWSLYDKKDNYLDPLEYSTGKNQRDLVKEIIEEFKENEIVLLEGMVGTGKSAVALNVAKELGRAIFSVPTKPLQDQYIEDYEKNLRVRKNKKSIEIEFIKGRNNFYCPYSDEADEECNCFRCKDKGPTADCKHLPCSVSIVDGKLKDHVILKDSVKFSESELRAKEDLSRLKIGELCPYWSPLYNFKLNKEGFSPEKYSSIEGESYWNKRNNEICPFYKQFRSYLDSDIIVYNSKMYEIETLYTERKPNVDLEVIDEADLFLDQLNMKTSIFYETVKKVNNKLGEEKSKKIRHSLKSVLDIFKEVINGEELNKFDKKINEFLSSLDFLLNKIEERWAENKQSKIQKILKFSKLASYVGSNDNRKKISFFVPKPDEVLNEFISNSADKILLMSGTLHSKRVLKNIFGLENIGYVRGEPKIPGDLIIKKPSKPIKLTSKRFNDKKIRKTYYKALRECINRSKKPCLVHIHAYRYLPKNLRKNVVEEQEKNISEFKAGKKDVLFSTKLKRGIDLKEEKCRSVVIQKYPYPDLSDPYLMALKERLGDAFWKYYEDMARRDLIQQIGRVVRNDNDWAEIWSPDKKVYYKLRGLRRKLNLS